MSPFRFGVLGENISYSLSPQIFEWGFQHCGLDGSYQIFDVKPNDVRKFLLHDTSWQGLSVTTPYKEVARELCSELSDSAKAIGAVNCVTRTSQGLVGDNTDEVGFRFALERLAGAVFEPEIAVVIGSGGAARAVLHALGEKYPLMRVEVVSRNPGETRTQLEPLGARFASFNVIDYQTAAQFMRDFPLVIQATPIGSGKMPGCPLPEPLKFRDKAVVLDLTYAPRKTRFLEYAERSGAQTQNGLIMLIAQAAAAFRIWTNRKFPLEQALQELLPQLSAA